MSVIKDAAQAVMKKAIEIAPDSLMPGGHPDPLIGRKHGLIGAPVSRIDGPLKVQGQARFAAEFPMDGMVYAALAYSAIAKGRIATLDTSAAEAADGVVLVMTHRNAPPLKATPVFMSAAKAAGGDDLAVMQDDRIHWNGQPIAVVLADTQEQADHAVSLIRATYAAEKGTTSFAAGKAAGLKVGNFQGEPLKHAIGDAEAALAAAPHKVDIVYRHASSQSQCHRTACRDGGVDRRGAEGSRCLPRRRAHGVVARAHLRPRREEGPRHLALRGRRIRWQDAVEPSRPRGGRCEACGSPRQDHAVARRRVSRRGWADEDRATGCDRCSS